MALEAQIRVFAARAGADLVGIAPVETYRDYNAELERRLSETGATQADYMVPVEDVSFFSRLLTARNTMPEAAAIIVIGVYAYDQTAVYRKTRREGRGKIARTYSYYPVVRQIAGELTSFIQELGYSAAHGQDVPLKYVADRIGLGSYGKNGILLTEEYGSYIALRDVITDAPLAPDKVERVSLCQDCDLCLKACPTGALYAPYKVNPRLCINPITRKEGHIPPELGSKLRNWIHGCDICQEVCPVNRQLVPRKPDPRSGFDPQNHGSHRHLGGLERLPRLADLVSGDYPDVIRRNAAIALANIGTGGERSDPREPGS